MLFDAPLWSSLRRRLRPLRPLLARSALQGAQASLLSCCCCLCVSLYACASVCLSLSLSLCVCLYMSVSGCLSLSQSVCLSVSVPVCLCLSLSVIVCVSVSILTLSNALPYERKLTMSYYMYVCLSLPYFFPSVCMFAYLSLRLSVYLSVSGAQSLRSQRSQTQPLMKIYEQSTTYRQSTPRSMTVHAPPSAALSAGA